MSAPQINAPIAEEQDRKALSWIINRLRPDLDRKGIESAMAKQAEQTLDVLALASIIGAATRPDQLTPAFLGKDGEHVNRARRALNRTEAVGTRIPASSADLGEECAVCGVREGAHDGTRATVLHGPHPWQRSERKEPMTPEGLARAKALRDALRASARNAAPRTLCGGCTSVAVCALDGCQHPKENQ